MVRENELRSEIVRNGYTIKSLAEEMHMSENTLGAKIRGNAVFDIREVQQLCDLLHIVDPMRKIYIFLP